MRLFVLLALPALAAPSGAQETLRRVRLEAQDPPRAAAELEAAGYDVLAGALGPRTLDLVVTLAELSELAERFGLEPEVIEVGQPFLLKEAADGVPGGYPDLAQVEARLAQA